jgi:hypothetical protein
MLGNNSLTVIRFNPDKYKDKNKKINKSLFGTKDNKLQVIYPNKYKMRLEILINTIKSNINYNKNEINNFQLFYDEI